MYKLGSRSKERPEPDSQGRRRLVCQRMRSAPGRDISRYKVENQTGSCTPFSSSVGESRSEGLITAGI